MTAPGNTLLVWVVVLLAALGTFLIRLSFFELFGRIDEIPPRVRRVLLLVPAAVLAALVAPTLALVDGALVVPWANYRLLAGAVGVVVAWRTENLALTILAGMVTFWTLEYLV